MNLEFVYKGIARLLVVCTLVTYCGLPDVLHAQSQNEQEQDVRQTGTDSAASSTPTVESPQSPPQNNSPSGVIDPSAGPLTPVPSNQNRQELPNAPGTIQHDEASQIPRNPSTEQPVGAAGAQIGPTAGGAASKPAGNAIAPAKQSQKRSFLIKIGAVAAAAAAIGTVVALSRGTSSTPPGAR